MIKTGRNEKCPCGSGKKFKNCCINNENVIPFSVEPEKNSFSLTDEPMFENPFSSPFENSHPFDDDFFSSKVLNKFFEEMGIDKNSLDEEAISELKKMISRGDIESITNELLDAQEDIKLRVDHLLNMSSEKFSEMLVNRDIEDLDDELYRLAERITISCSQNANVVELNIYRNDWGLSSLSINRQSKVIKISEEDDMALYILYQLINEEGIIYKSDPLISGDTPWWESKIDESSTEAARIPAWTNKQRQMFSETRNKLLQYLEEVQDQFKEIHIIFSSDTELNKATNSKTVDYFKQNGELREVSDEYHLPERTNFAIALASENGSLENIWPGAAEPNSLKFCIPEELRQWMHDNYYSYGYEAEEAIDDFFDKFLLNEMGRINCHISLMKHRQLYSIPLKQTGKLECGDSEWKASIIAKEKVLLEVIPKLNIKAEESLRLGHQLLYDIKRKKLTYLSYVTDYYEILSHLEKNLKALKKASQVSENQFSLSVVLENKEEVFEAFDYLNIDEESFFQSKPVVSSCRPAALFNSKKPNNFQVSIMTKESRSFFRLPFYAINLLDHIQFGIKERIDLDPFMSSLSDVDDYILLGHEGLNWFVHIRIWELIILNKTFEVSEKLRFEKDLITLCDQIINKNKKTKGEKCSAAFVGIISDYVKYELEHYEFDELYGIEGGAFVKYDFSKCVYGVLLSIAHSIIAKRGRNFFYRKGGYSNRFIRHDYYHESESEESNAFVMEDAYPQLIPHLPPDAEIFVDNQPIEKLREEDLRTLLDLSEEGDWFEMNPKFFFKGEEIDVEKALEFSEKPIVPFRGKLYQVNPDKLPSLRWLNRMWDQLCRKGHAKNSGKTSKIYQVPKSSALELLALRAAGFDVEGGEEWQSICRGFDSLSGNREKTQLKNFEHLSKSMKEHQAVGIQWLDDLYSMHLGGILADEMGLGKTLQMLGFFELLRQRNALGHSLIVVPTSLVYNWKSEVKKFIPDLPLRIFEKGAKEEFKEILNDKNSQCLMITSYGLLRRHEDVFHEYQWNVICFDEAQALKNIKSKSTNSARKLVARSKFCISGTPLENHLGEFYSLIDLVVPGSFGTYQEFMKVYSDKRAPGKSSKIDPEDIKFLKLKSRPLVLRREKEVILKDLPGKTENVVSIPFEKQQKAIYKDIAIKGNDVVQSAIEDKGEERSQLEILTALLRLRQVCSCPNAIPGVNYKKTPPKVEALIEQVETLLDKGESVLVFTNFINTLEYIMDIFEDHRYSALCIHGGISMSKRAKVLEEFDKSEEACLLIMTLKTGGVGLNLTKARHVFHLEPWWNPAAENQGTDRVHRMGQTDHVHVIRMLVEHSIEENIQEYKAKKSQIFDALFSETEKGLKEEISTKNFAHQKLSKKDFEKLLKL